MVKIWRKYILVIFFVICASKGLNTKDECSDAKAFTTFVNEAKPNKEYFGCQNPTERIELCDYEGYKNTIDEEEAMELTDKEILNLYDQCSHKANCTIPMVFANRAGSWYIRIKYYCSDWKPMCEDFRQEFKSVNLLQTRDDTERSECNCRITGQADVELVDLRLNYDKNTCSSTELDITINVCKQSSGQHCETQSYTCNQTSNNFGTLSFRRNEVKNVQSISLRTQACPATMVWLKLKAKGSQNVALYKTVTMSSTYYTKTYGTAPGSNAVNGIKSGLWKDGSCASTIKEASPWMLLNLHATYSIHGMQIVNRQSHGERLSNLHIEFGETEENLIAIFYHDDVVPPVLNITFEKTHFGKYMKFWIEKNEFLTICEIEVYALPRLQCSSRDISTDLLIDTDCPLKETTSSTVPNKSLQQEQSGNSKLTTIVLATALCLMCLLVTAGVIWFIYYKRRTKKNEDTAHGIINTNVNANGNYETQSVKKQKTRDEVFLQNETTCTVSQDGESKEFEDSGIDSGNAAENVYCTITDDEINPGNKDNIKDKYTDIKPDIIDMYTTSNASNEYVEGTMRCEANVDDPTKEFDNYDHLNGRVLHNSNMNVLNKEQTRREDNISDLRRYATEGIGKSTVVEVLRSDLDSIKDQQAQTVSDSLQVRNEVQETACPNSNTNTYFELTSGETQADIHDYTPIQPDDKSLQRTVEAIQPAGYAVIQAEENIQPAASTVLRTDNNTENNMHDYFKLEANT